MAIVGMKKVFAAGMKAERMEILDRLISLGVMQVDVLEQDATDEEEIRLARSHPSAELSEIDSALYRLKSALSVLAEYAPVKKKLFAKRRQLSKDAFRAAGNEVDSALKTAQVILQMQEERARVLGEKNHAGHEAELLERFRGLDIPLDVIGTKRTRIVYGSIPVILDPVPLADSLRDKDAFFWQIGADEENRYAGVIYLTDEEAAVQAVLSEEAFSELHFPDVHGTPEEASRQLRRRQDELEARYEQLAREIEEQASCRELLETVYDYLDEQRDKYLIVERFLHTDTVFMARGWIPARDAERVKQSLEGEFESILMELSDPEPDEVTPILLKNNALVAPFEMITELYSLPKANEVDPNPAMSIFYFIFFGLMLSDAGYGIALTVLTGFVLLLYKPEGMSGKLMRLLCLCGISTTVWGVLFGGWFGDALGLPAVWFSPIDDPMTLLLWSFVFGGVHLFVGMGIRAFLLIRRGRWLDALFDIGFWYALLVGLVLFVLSPKAGAVVAGIGAAGLVLTQGRHEKNVFKKLLSGIMSLYDITGYLSDILSYSRLLALGLATGVIANVINTMCRLAGGGNFAIWIVVAVGFVFGHVFNLAINTLGAYVHASRLQYVEFFGKFYEGGGTAFVPFRRRGKYVEVK